MFFRFIRERCNLNPNNMVKTKVSTAMNKYDIVPKNNNTKTFSQDFSAATKSKPRDFGHESVFPETSHPEALVKSLLGEDHANVKILFLSKQ